jgi:hypothetical protein
VVFRESPRTILDIQSVKERMGLPPDRLGLWNVGYAATYLISFVDSMGADG